MSSHKIAVAAAVNSQQVLEQCLAHSPDIASGIVPLRIYEGYQIAALAYNKALAECDAEWLVLAHQDVYLPKGFIARAVEALTHLSEVAPDWAVAGLVGATNDRNIHGRIWCSGNGGEIGDGAALPARVITLDELVLIIRTDAGLQFDDQLPGFHMYGADIVLQAEAQGRTAWVINAPAIHHSKPVVNLGGDYARASRYMRKKWASRLPVYNLCCPITATPMTLWVNDIRVRWRNRGRTVRPDALGDPAEIAQRLGFETP